MIQYRHPHPAVTVDLTALAISNGELQVLLIKRALPPHKGRWVLPGGFVGIEESLEDAATRVLSDKASMQGLHLEQLYTFGAVRRDPRERVISVAYLAIVPQPDPAPQTGRWVAALSAPKLGFDHSQILTTAIERLQAKLNYSNLAARFLAPEFTLTELQSVFEIILDAPLEKRNFRKQILARGMIEATGRMNRGGAHRPARLYRLRGDR